MQDAVPITLGQEFSAFVQQIKVKKLLRQANKEKINNENKYFSSRLIEYMLLFHVCIY